MISELYKLLLNERPNVNIFVRQIGLYVALLAVLFPDIGECQRQPVYPCVDFMAIRWVRDANYCDQYFICHFGQPMSMPSCPHGQVWSNKALNCVPEFSRWDDCNVVALETVPVLEQEKSEGYQTAGYDTKEKTNLQLPPTQHRDEGETVISVEQLPTQESKMINIIPKSLAKTVYRNSQVMQNNIAKSHDVYQIQITTRKPIQVTRPMKLWPLPKRQEPHRMTESPVVQQQHARRYEAAERNTTQPPITRTTTRPSTARRPVTSSRRPVTVTEQAVIRKVSLISKDDRQQPRLKNRQEAFKMTTIQPPRVKNLGISEDHPCQRHPGALVPHPKNCHWYYNCTLPDVDDSVLEEPYDDQGQDTGKGFFLLKPFRVRSAGAFVWECRFPQLFDDVTNTCREFVNVQCKSRFEPVEQCEYSARQQCRDESCVPCHNRFGRCRGRENGVYPVHEDKWTPLFVTCYLQRNIALDECIPPNPIFSPETMDCVSLFEVPKEHGGFLPDCSSRPDGYYPDEQGRCAIFFRCALGKFRGYDECPPGSVFDPAIPSCQPFHLASKPCGEGQAPLCGGKLDGYYADPHGRCTHYFECRNGAFQQYNICDLGIFDPLTQKCVVSAELTVRPCGLQPSPCETLPTGVYPDQATGCHNFIECQRGVMLTNGTCAAGAVFSAITGRCGPPEHAPPPCGFSSTCVGKPDGRYPALSRGCSFFYECYHEQFVSLRRCTASDGGFFFNPATGECDYPQNICPPCGYKWWGCDRTYQL